MKPVYAKKLFQSMKCHSEPFASLEDRLREESHHFRKGRTLHFAQGDSYEVAPKNSRPGVAILVVLFVIIVATIISLSFIARSDTELAFGNNMAFLMQMDYLAESGLAHATAMLKNPQDIETDPNVFWPGGEGFSLKDFDFYGLWEAGDYYYDPNITRDDTDPTDRCNYDISSLVYRREGGDKIPKRHLNARLRLDPCIAYWAGADAAVSSRIIVNGDVYCSGNLTNSGTINGDVHALSLALAGAGTVEGRWYDIGVSPLGVGWPGLGVDYFTPQYYIGTDVYTPQVIADANELLDSLPLDYTSNPAGVIVCNGNLTLMGNVAIEGTLIVNGQLVLNGSSLNIDSKKNFPALVVNGDLNVVSGRLTVTGLAQVNTMSVGSAASNAAITGALFVRDSGISVEGGYAGNITITTGPMIASTKVSSDASTTVRWTPIGGAFFKWIKRD